MNNLPSMERADAILGHPMFCRELAAIEEAERDRRFCRHGLAHLLDVARVAWILVLEEELELECDLVYAAALLHDIGRGMQYSRGVSHDEAGVEIAREILGTVEADRRFSSSERCAILAAVRGHRGAADQGEPAFADADCAEAEADRSAALARVIRVADHASRACFACPVREECYWPDEKKNLTLRI